MPYTDRHWQKFFTAAGHEQHNQDPRFATIEARTEHIAYVYETLGKIIATQPTSHWIELFEREQIPAAAVNRLEDLENDPHLKSVGLFADVTDAQCRRYRFTRNPVRMQHSTVAPALAPRLGEHTREVLHQAGLDKTAIDHLIDQGAARADE
jgi:crotonobetainyl-CoA:carnitine CoA-transferase CaiB-like acyl-CoA transferase